MAAANVDIVNRVRRILIDAPFAVLSTVGEDSTPFTRWMSPIFATGDLKEFHALAAPRSRKIEHLRTNPRVTWVFSSPDFEDVVTIHGKAFVDEDPALRAEIWERMPEKQRSFILRNDENLQFAIIRTDVERVEHLRPREGQTEPTTFAP